MAGRFAPRWRLVPAILLPCHAGPQRATWGGFTFAAADVNADGRADLIASYIGVSGWSLVVKMSAGDGTYSTAVTWSTTGNWSGFTFTAADTTGKGRMDSIAYYLGVNGNSKAVASAAAQPMAIANVTTGLGAATAITYLPLTNSTAYTKDTNAVYPLQDAATALCGVPCRYLERRRGNYSSTYSYAGAKQDWRGRGFLGFRQTQIKDMQTSIVKTNNFARTSFHRSRCIDVEGAGRANARPDHQHDATAQRQRCGDGERADHRQCALSCVGSQKRHQQLRP